MKRLVHMLCCGLKYAQDSALWLVCSAAVLHILGFSGNMLPLIAASLIAGMLSGSTGNLSDGKQTARLPGNLSGGIRTMITAAAVLLPVLTAAFLVRSLPAALAAVPVVVYIAKSVRDQAVPDYEETVKLFPMEAAAILIGGLICRYEDMDWGLTAAVLFLISGVFLMRILRQEREGNLDNRSFLLEIALTLVFSGVCVFFSRPEVDQVILQALRSVWTAIMTPVIYAMSGILYVVIWIGSRLFCGWQGFSADSEDVALDFQNPIADLEAAENPVMNSWAGRIASAILILLLVIVAVILFRRLRVSLRPRQGAGGRGTEIRRSQTEVHRRESDSVPMTDRSPRAKVRRAYASFLRELSAAGYPAEISDTTEDINEKLVPESCREPADQLRTLYLRARYSEEDGVTAEDAAEAVRLARTFRKIVR